MVGWRLRALSGVAVISLGVAFTPVAASAQSLAQALTETYSANPTLNAARAQLRITNEGIPIALSGARPTLSASADVSQQNQFNSTTVVNTQTNRSTTTQGFTSSQPRGYSLTANQNLFDGWRTDNAVRRAEALVGAAREVLRTSEQDVFLAAATAYMDVIQNTSLVELQRGNVNAISELLRATQNRFQVGEVTRTDVAQAEARLALARANLAVANANLNASRAAYRRVIGRDPGRLSPATTVERLLPRTLEAALSSGSREHPQVRAAVFNVDAGAFAVKVAEATMLPTVALQAILSHRFSATATVNETASAQVLARVTIPIYDGGLGSANVRQAKETMAQSRINIDVVRDTIRANVVGTWGALEQQRALGLATTAQIEASQIALNGVREEARVGQRTTLDVLNAEQDLLNARVQRIQNDRNRIVAMFTLLGAIGRLNAQALSLQVALYDPGHHLSQVRDLWHGLRTPGGD